MNSHLELDDSQLFEFIQTHLVDNRCEGKLLPCPVFSYVKPSMGVQFILHILLSMGRFGCEVDLFLKPSLKESLRHAKLIGPSDEPDQLKQYSNALLKWFIEEQLIFFPKTKQVIDLWILSAAEVFDCVIVNDSIPISELSSIQFSSLYGNPDNQKLSQLLMCRFRLVFFMMLNKF